MLFHENKNKFSGKHDSQAIEALIDTHSWIHESFWLNANQGERNASIDDINSHFSKKVA